MIGFYNYDSRVFDDMTLPEDINKADFINVFLLKYGECPVIYPNWGTMKFALGVWSKKWYHSIERIITAMTEEYNPLYNFDRHEEYTDTEDIDRATTLNQGSQQDIVDDTTERTLDLANDQTTENTIAAYNASTYQPDTKSEIGGTNTGTDTSVRNGTIKNKLNSSGSEGTDRELQHEGHLYGNIGVTESTTMLQHEIDLRKNQNIMDIVADMLYKEICIYVY